MKKVLFSLLCMLAAGITHAQSQVGIIRYTLPEGWYARKSDDGIVLERKGTENSGCSITLQEIGSAVTSEKEYGQLWASKTKTGDTKIAHTNPAVKTEADGWISFSGSNAMAKKASTSSEGFYTLSDGNKTVMILVQAEDDLCIDEIDSILASVHIPDKANNPGTKAKAKRVRVAALKSLKALVN